MLSVKGKSHAAASRVVPGGIGVDHRVEDDEEFIMQAVRTTLCGLL